MPTSRGALDKGHADRILARLERDAFPAFGKLSMRAVTSTKVLAMVRGVEARRAIDVSRRLKQHVGQIYRDDSPYREVFASHSVALGQ